MRKFYFQGFKGRRIGGLNGLCIPMVFRSKQSKTYFLYWKMLLCLSCLKKKANYTFSERCYYAFLACKRKQILLFSNPSGMSEKDAKRCYYVFLLKKESKNLSKPEPNLPWVRYFIIPWDRKTRIGASLNLTGYATRDL